MTGYYQDYRTLLRHAGLPDDEVERIAAQAELDRESEMNEDQELEQDQWLERKVVEASREAAIDLWDNMPIYIEGKTCSVKLDPGSGLPLSVLLRFANVIAKMGLGSNIKIVSSTELYIEIEFDIIR